ncbi:MAG: ferredoxin reductase family protein, partial [Patescibacteria group bacterium]
FLEKYFHGLDKIYENHSRLGQIALILLLAHPLFLLPKYTSGDWQYAAVWLLPSANWAQNWGWFSLALMIGLLILTLYLRPKYNLWKLTHKFLGLAFFLAVLHILLIRSDTTIYPLLKIYLLALSAVALGAFAYRALFGRWLVRKHLYRVAKVTKISDTVVEITLSPEGQPLRFQPGQFVFISFEDINVGRESHPFSISSSNHDRDLTITVKQLGDYTAKITNLTVGAAAKVEGPFGYFSYHNAENFNQIWIAGGIGITPFVSMAQSLPNDGSYKIDLFYCAKTAAEAVYLQQLTGLNPSLKVIAYCSDQKTSRLDAKTIAELAGTLSGKDIFICGPAPMMRDLRRQLIAEGINQKFIHIEEFSF